MKNSLLFAGLCGAILCGGLFLRLRTQEKVPVVSSTLATPVAIDTTTHPVDASIVESQLTLRRDPKQARVLAALPEVAVGEAQLLKQWTSLLTVSALEFSPDGKLLAVAGEGNNAARGGVDLRSTANWQSEAEIFGTRKFAWAPNSRLLAIESRGVEIWDVRKNRKLRTLSDGSGMNQAGKDGSAGVSGPMIFSADSSKLATLGEDPKSTWTLGEGAATEGAYLRALATKFWDVSRGKRLKLRVGPSSGDGYSMVRVSDDPKRVDFAAPTRAICEVSATKSPIYVYSSYASGHKLMSERFPIEENHASIVVSYEHGGTAISGNAWIYAKPTNNMKGETLSVDIYRTRDQKLLHSLDLTDSISRAAPDPIQFDSNQVTALAISPDATTLAVAQYYVRRKIVTDKTYGKVIQDVSTTRVSIYQLDTNN